MFNRILFICFFFLCFPVFGEKISKNDSIAPSGNIQAKKNAAPISSVEIEPNLTESYQVLKNHKEMLRLEWMGGMGIANSKAFLIPLTLKIQGPVTGQQNDSLKWSLQAGGVFLSTFDWEKGISYILQPGLKYNFSNKFYGSFKGGAIHILSADRVWTGGLFFGSESNILTLEGGIQVFYLSDNEWDFGIGLNIGTVIKKWWVEK